MEAGASVVVCMCACLNVGVYPRFFSLFPLFFFLHLLCVRAAVLLLRFILSLCLPTFSFGNVFCFGPTATDQFCLLLICPQCHLTHPPMCVCVWGGVSETQSITIKNIDKCPYNSALQRSPQTQYSNVTVR